MTGVIFVPVSIVAVRHPPGGVDPQARLVAVILIVAAGLVGGEPSAATLTAVVMAVVVMTPVWEHRQV